MKVFLWIIGGAVALFVLFIAFGAIVGPSSSGNPAERIDAECQRSFGAQGQIAVNDCRLRLYTRTIQEDEKRKLDDAYRRAR